MLQFRECWRVKEFDPIYCWLQLKWRPPLLLCTLPAGHHLYSLYYGKLRRQLWQLLCCCEKDGKTVFRVGQPSCRKSAFSVPPSPPSCCFLPISTAAQTLGFIYSSVLANISTAKIGAGTGWRTAWPTQHPANRTNLTRIQVTTIRPVNDTPFV